MIATRKKGKQLQSAKTEDNFFRVLKRTHFWQRYMIHIPHTYVLDLCCSLCGWMQFQKVTLLKSCRLSASLRRGGRGRCRGGSLSACQPPSYPTPRRGPERFLVWGAHGGRLHPCTECIGASASAQRQLTLSCLESWLLMEHQTQVLGHYGQWLTGVAAAAPLRRDAHHSFK